MQKANKVTTGNHKKKQPASKKFNQQVIERLVEKYGVSKRFIKMSITGERESETSTTIKKDYKVMEAKVNVALKQALK